MDMENLLMEMVMGSTRRDRSPGTYPHPSDVEEVAMKHPRARKPLNRRRSSRSGPRVEPRMRVRRGHGEHGRQGGLVAAFRKLLRLN